MILLCVLTTLIPLCYCQNAELKFPKTCYKADETLTIEATYTGTGTPQLVTWTYSGSSLIVETTGCTLISSVPAGFPDASRLSYKCVTTDLSLPANTYNLIVTGLQTDELDKTWAVTFTPPTGTAPAAVQSPVPTDCSNCKCVCDCVCRTIVIVSMVFGILGALVLLIVIGGLLTGCFDEKKTTLLVFDGIGIVSDVLSLILSIVVKVKECCEENCECCEEDSECCNDWIDNAAIAFIVIPCLAVVVSVVIFILVKLDIIGPGRNAYKAKEAKDPGENHGMTGTSM